MGTISHWESAVKIYKNLRYRVRCKMVKEEREYIMLNECKLNNSCKSGNRVL
jgi:hypothetical protein